MIDKIIKSILAGVAIALGSIIYLLCPDKVAGAFLFSIGILLVMEYKLLLFTGYVPTQRTTQSIKEYFINSGIVFVGNVIGGAIAAVLIMQTRLKDTLWEATKAISEIKITDSHLSVFILAIFCGIIIAGIVKATNLKKQVLYVGMMIATFILCGYEHVVANAFYLTASKTILTGDGIIFMLVCMLGNFVGGALCSFVQSPNKNDN